MTKEEALDELNVIYERLSHTENCEQGVYSFRDGDYLEALDIAIKALKMVEIWDGCHGQIIAPRGTFEEIYNDVENDTVDKIRAEIKALSNANPSYWHSGDMVDRDDVLEILDKYRTESE